MEPRGPRARRQRGRAVVSLLLTVALVLGATAGVGIARAEDASADAPPVKHYGDWFFQVTPYVWLPAIQGSVQIRQLTVPVDADIGRVADLLWNGQLWALFTHFEAKNRGLSLFVDALGGTARPQKSGDFASTNLTLNFSFIEFGPAYQILSVDNPQLGRPIQIDALVGGRYMYFYDSITVKGNRDRLRLKASTTLDWVDPFVGGRFSVPVVGPVDILFRGDIGGFGAGSQLVWNIVSGLQAELPWHPFATRTMLTAAYKVIDFDYTTGSDPQKKTVKLDMRGPGIGLGFEF
jgi:hypothetical protein